MELGRKLNNDSCSISKFNNSRASVRLSKIELCIKIYVIFFVSKKVKSRDLYSVPFGR